MWIPNLQALSFLVGMTSTVMAAEPLSTAQVDESTLLAKATRKLTPGIARQVEKRLSAVCDYSDNPSFGIGNILGGANPGRNVAYVLEKLGVAAPHKIAADQIRIVQNPANGTLNPLRMVDLSIGEGWPETMIYRYTPNPGFLGKDHALFEVEIDGQKIRVGYDFIVGINQDSDCPGDKETQLEDSPKTTIQVTLDNRFLDQTEGAGVDANLESWLAFTQLQNYVAGLSGSTFDFVNQAGEVISSTYTMHSDNCPTSRSSIKGIPSKVDPSLS